MEIEKLYEMLLQKIHIVDDFELICNYVNFKNLDSQKNNYNIHFIFMMLENEINLRKISIINVILNEIIKLKLDLKKLQNTIFELKESHENYKNENLIKSFYIN